MAAANPRARLLADIKADLVRLAALARASQEHADASIEHVREALYAYTLADTERHLDEAARSDQAIQTIGTQVWGLHARIRTSLAANVPLSDAESVQMAWVRDELERHMAVQRTAEKEVEGRMFALPRLMQRKRETMRTALRPAGEAASAASIDGDGVAASTDLYVDASAWPWSKKKKGVAEPKKEEKKKKAGWAKRTLDSISSKFVGDAAPPELALPPPPPPVFNSLTA